ncbi:MAG TPA: hypothetical protein VF163_18165 [Micromonosporaceae bacterium]
MKRSNWTGQVLVYRYGCPSSADLPEEGMRQLRLANNLRNELVAVEYRYREMVAAIWSGQSNVAEAEARLAQASAEVDALTVQAKRERIADQSTLGRDATKREMAAARAARREARDAVKAAKAADKAAAKPMLDEAHQARYDAISTLRAEAVDAGLFWATANDVNQNHASAAKLIAEAWKSGRAAQRRFRRWDGSGTITVQMIRQQGMPARTPQLLASGEGPYRNVVQLAPWMPDWPKGRGPHRHGVLKARITKGGAQIEIPVVLHRALPADADVAEVRITRTVVGGNARLSVALTARLPAPGPVNGGTPVGVVLGWASDGAGAVRVARLNTPYGVLTPPPEEFTRHPYANVLAFGEGFVDVYAPAEWRVLLERDASIRSHRDDLLDELRPLIVDALAEPVLAETVETTAADVVRWRSPRRFVQLAYRWPQSHPLAAKLEAWRVRDAHLWQYESHERQQVTSRRRDAYRKVAAWICDQASEVLIDSPEVAALREVAPVGEEDRHEARAGRRQIQFAAPGDFRAAVEHAASRRGVPVINIRKDSNES